MGKQTKDGSNFYEILLGLSLSDQHGNAQKQSRGTRGVKWQLEAVAEPKLHLPAVKKKRKPDDQVVTDLLAKWFALSPPLREVRGSNPTQCQAE